MKLSENLFTLRRKAGLSQEELADRIGVSRQAVGKWENAAAVPEVDKLIALSELFGVSLGELLGLEAPAAGEAKADTGELEAFLKNYAEEQKLRLDRYDKLFAESGSRETRRRGRLWILLGAVCAAVAVLGIVLGTRISQLNDQLYELQRNSLWQYNTLSGDIYSMKNSITGLLEQQASLFSDFSCDVTDYDPASGVTVRVSVTPKALTGDTRAEFLLTEEVTGVTYRAAGERLGTDFVSALTVPGGTYALTVILDADGVSNQETVGIYSVSPADLAAEFYFRWLEGPEYEAGGLRYHPQGLLMISCYAGDWPARGLSGAELVLYKNDEETARVSLDTADENNWYGLYEIPEEYLELIVGDPAVSRPSAWTAADGHTLFVAEFDLGTIDVRAGDMARIELVVTDELGLVYREEHFQDFNFTPGALSSRIEGRLDLDYALYW